MEHYMETVRRTGSTPVTKQEPKPEGRDATLAAQTLLAEVMAHVRAGDKVWHGFAARIINGTTDMRAAFIKGLAQHLADLRKANTAVLAAVGKDGKPNPTKEETKIGGKTVATATVYVTYLRTIAHAWNSGGHLDGLKVYVGERNRLDEAQIKALSLDDIGFTVIKEYADKFKESDARGRKADPFTVKLSKWLDKNPAGEGDKTGEALHAVISKLVAEQLAKDQAI